jgi:ribosome-associated protein
MGLFMEIELRTEFITLGQLVKYLGLVGSGAEVKMFLADAEVLVNGEPDNRRGRKLYPGDSVTFAGEEAVLITGGISSGAADSGAHSEGEGEEAE